MEMPLWVVEAKLDIPARFENYPNDPRSFMWLSLGGDDPDGFVQLQPLDIERTRNKAFWSISDPMIYRCRALVRAPAEFSASMRGKELYEHVADRLTLLYGYPARVIAVGFVYNEHELKDCIAGKATEYSTTSGGEEVTRNNAPKNLQHQTLMNPPASALEAIRWFRRGMISSLRVEAFLFYYIALESIAKHIPGVTRERRRDSAGKVKETCPACGGEPELETRENAAIKFLLTRRGLPMKNKGQLATVRARIAHGNTDTETIDNASRGVGIIQRLAADGIALVCGIDPDQFNVLQPAPFLDIVPLGKAIYSDKDDPTVQWGGLLSDAFAKCMEQIKLQSPNHI